VLGKPCGVVNKSGINNGGIKTIEEKQIIKQPIYLMPLPSPICNENWNYDKKGLDWNCKCMEGHLQSPIDLPPIQLAKQDYQEIVLDYTPTDT